MAVNNQPTGAEAMVHMLEKHRVRNIFGLCGDTSLPFYDALATLDHGMRHILMRDERHAGYAADAYARVTGDVGVCEGPSGGGATHILPGVVEANESSVPVLALTSDVATSSEGRFSLTELDQESLFRPLTKFCCLVRRADALPRMVRAAFRAATSVTSGSVHLGLPFDVQCDPVPPEEIWADPKFGKWPSLRPGPDPEDAAQLLSRLLSAAKPVMIVGGGIALSGAYDELRKFVELLDLPLCTSVSGKGALAETHPNCAGVVGSNGGVPATRALVEQADVVFFAGCRGGSVTTERWRCPRTDQKLIHLDSNPAVIGANYPMEAALRSDARLGLSLLCRLLEESGETRKFFGAALVAAAKEKKWGAFGKLSRSTDVPIRPELVVATLNALAPDNTILVADPGTPCPYFSAYFELRNAGRHLITNRAHGALGYALGASLGAQVGCPEAKVIAVMGDGSFGFAVGELETLCRLGLPVMMVVFSNASYGWIKAGQKHGFGNRYYSVDFSRTDHAAIAAAYGCNSWSVRSPERLEPVLRAAINEDGPALVDVWCQPLEESAAPVSEWVA